VPLAAAVYVIFRPAVSEPRYFKTSSGGHHKGNDPTVAIDVLKTKWVAGSQLVYIGKADVARRRLNQFARFGAGEPVGHWGGRYIWQLADSPDLLVAWHEIAWGETARDYERRLLVHFAALHAGARPFANLTG
jgi:hypothetical protein